MMYLNLCVGMAVLSGSAQVYEEKGECQSSPGEGGDKGQHLLQWKSQVHMKPIHRAPFSKTPHRSPHLLNESVLLDVQDAEEAGKSLVLSKKPLHDTHLRPHVGDKADVVRFAMRCKEIYHIDLKSGTFVVDLVITLKWSDRRATDLVPNGMSSFTLSTTKAAKKIWFPDVSISNRAHKGLDIISSAVSISAETGEITKVERVLAKINKAFDVSAFPFDVQHLQVRLVSTSLMADELKLVPIEDEGELSGVDQGIFREKDFFYEGNHLRAFEEKDGMLVKSRGELDIVINRDTWTYISCLLLPEFLLLGISIAVFFFPMQVPFIMPRVATSLISYMALATLNLRTNTMLPVRGGLSWIDLFEGNVQILMFTAIGFNIFVEAVNHQVNDPTLATRINYEIKIGFPLLAVLVFWICFHRTDGTGLHYQELLSQSLVGGTIFIYVLYCGRRVQLDAQRAKT